MHLNFSLIQHFWNKAGGVDEVLLEFLWWGWLTKPGTHYSIAVNKAFSSVN